MTDSVHFTATSEASEFLSSYFGVVSIVENDHGVTCALPGVFALKHVPVRTATGRNLRTIHEMSVTAPDREEGLIRLANKVNLESVILKHFPKPNDRYEPTANADYVIIDREDRLHSHEYAGFIDFNMAVFDEGAIQLGSVATQLDPQWHIHLAPAADITT